MKVVRVYHAGRDAAHRERDRALVRAGVHLTLVVPAAWPGPDEVGPEPFDVVELEVRRPGDVNRHTYRDAARIAQLVERLEPDVVDLHEEPFSGVVHQLLRALPTGPAVVTYAAQNIDKRFPPPFAQWERAALSRITGIYPCTRQAASVVVGKGFRGAVQVLPLGPPPQITPGDQPPPSGGVAMLLVGRLVPEKGVLDAVRALAVLRERTAASLEIVGEGPEAQHAQALAAELGVSDALTMTPWLSASDLAARYRRAQVLLAPSRATRTWVEQFGRMVVEAHAAGAVVIGYASGSLPEVVGDAGLLVPQGDPTALAAAVIELQQNPTRWQSLREAGFEVARSRTWGAVAEGQLSLYEKASSQPPLPVLASRRRAAVQQWGAPARIAGGGRPFALPVLREDTTMSRVLARAIDLAGRRPERPGDPRTRVVYVDHVARMSGGEMALVRLIEATPDIDAHVILGEDGPLRKALENVGASVEVLPLDPGARDVRRAEAAGAGGVRAAGAILRYTLRLSRRLRDLEPDLVHTNSLKAGYYGSAAARLAGVPVVWHLRDRIAEDYMPRRAVVLTRGVLRVLPNVVVCNSAETLRQAGKRVRLSAVIGSPVVHDPYEVNSSTSTSRGGNVIGMVGRIAPWKGQDVFVRAIAAVASDLPDVRGRIIGSAMFGEDDYERELRSLVTQLGVDDKITFTGFVEEVEDELARMDVLVHASVVPEPFGQVIVEGMAAGLPVIATSAGGPAEIVTDGINGLLVPPGDVGALTDGLRLLVRDPDLRTRLGRSAVERAKDFSPEVIGEQMQAVYSQLLNRTRRRARVAAPRLSNRDS